MLFGNPDLYAEVRRAKLGSAKLTAPLERLRTSLSDQFAINVLHVIYDRIDIGPAAGRPRLKIYLETHADAAAICDDGRQLNQDVEEASKQLLASNVDQSIDTSNPKAVLVCFDVFAEEAMGQAARYFRERHGDAVVAEFRDANVWVIDGFSKYTVVFFETDIDVSINSRGVSGEIKDRCFELTKLYDEFDYFAPQNFPIGFDSKETLDSEYRGSIFYYFK